MKTILNTKIVDTREQPLFLGEDLSLQRYDSPKYPVFLEQYNDQIEAFWRPEEIELKKDRGDFKKLSEQEQFIFLSNLKFQTMLDSVIARGVPTVTQFVSNPELEICMNAWGFFENIHSKSYSYLIQNVFADPKAIMDSVLEDEEILKRAKSVAMSYDALNKDFASKNDLKRQIYLTLVNINILEGLRFYVSFACALAFEQVNKMAGNARIIRLIKTDEAKHMFITQSVIKILRENPAEGFQQTIASNKDEAVKLFLDAVVEEKEWASYLFKDGGLIGLNEAILHQYIEWLCDTRMHSLGLPKQFNTKNPISWLDLDSEKEQVAPQEAESISYKVGAWVDDIEGADFDLDI
jgi:ribonucleoside-diphosphate reductase beta chain